jgi:protein-L-isoaspartate(D-aspartate) O-methyltransferase
MGFIFLVILVISCGSNLADLSGANRNESRDRMVRQLEEYGISDERVLAAMRAVPRHLFIPEKYRDTFAAYGDHPGPIGYGQTISQPYIVAYMTEQLDLKPGEKVLEIGTGSGYQAAVLASLGAEVYSIEIIPELADHARKVLADQGVDNVHILTGDGYKGWPEYSPFDAIIVTCGPERIPRLLVEQLKEEGRMILPLGSRYHQRLVICRKKGGEVMVEEDLPVRFVPMVHGDR